MRARRRWIAARSLSSEGGAEIPRAVEHPQHLDPAVGGPVEHEVTLETADREGAQPDELAPLETAKEPQLRMFRQESQGGFDCYQEP